MRITLLLLVLVGCARSSCAADPRAGLLRQLNGNGQLCVDATRDDSTHMILISQCLDCIAEWKAACADAGFDSDCGPDNFESNRSCF